MKTPRLIFVPILLAIVCIFSPACSKPADPRTTPITASTPEEFAAWKNATAKKITENEMQEFDSCVNEIRLGIQQRKEASGSDQIAQKLCEYINGKTMREVIATGYTSTVEWVSKELAFQRKNIQAAEEALKNSTNETKNAERRDYLVTAKDNVAKLEARLEKAKARLAELQK